MINTHFIRMGLQADHASTPYTALGAGFEMHFESSLNKISV